MVIPARAGSKRLLQKNLREVGGGPLVRRAVDCANAAAARLRDGGHDVDVIVSHGGSDDREVEAIESACPPGTTFLRRPDNLCEGKDVDGYPHGMAAPLWALECASAKYDAVVLLQPTSPLRTAEAVVASVRAFVERGGYYSLVSCCCAGVPNGAIYISNADRLLQSRTWGYATALWWVMPQAESIDVDCEVDLAKANELANAPLPE